MERPGREGGGELGVVEEPGRGELVVDDLVLEEGLLAGEGIASGPAVADLLEPDLCVAGENRPEG